MGFGDPQFQEVLALPPTVVVLWGCHSRSFITPWAELPGGASREVASGWARTLLPLPGSALGMFCMAAEGLFALDSLIWS